jgi:hypothetical protein
MDNLSLENEKKIIKLEGELTLLHHKIDTIRDNHLHHIDLRINNIYKVLWFVAALSITSLVNLVLTLIS